MGSRSGSRNHDVPAPWRPLLACFLLFAHALCATTPKPDVVQAEKKPTNKENHSGNELQWILCSGIIPNFETPCICARSNSTAPSSGNDRPEVAVIHVDCDGVSLRKEFPSIPPQLPVESYSHRDAGFRALEGNLFAAGPVPLRRLDLSRNLVQRLPEQLFAGVAGTLREVILGGNCLGRQLNPVFATDQFHELAGLRLLDLSDNGIRALEDGVFRGLGLLEVLRLDRNDLDTMPLSSIRGLAALLDLELQHNSIGELQTANLATMVALRSLNLSSNVISDIADGAFGGLVNLRTLDLSNNKLRQLNNPNAFVGASDLRELRLGNNFLGSVPTQALRPLDNLSTLDLASNGIRELNLDDFAEMPALERLDLSRNRIAELPPTVFLPLIGLRELLLDSNLLHKLEPRVFDGLQALERLRIDDNNLLVLPQLDALPALRHLVVGYNRIAAVSHEMVQPLAGLEELLLDFNLMRDIPEGTFQNFSRLRRLSLRGNLVGSISERTLEGVESTMTSLDLSTNALEEFPSLPPMNLLETLDLSKNKIVILPDDVLAGFPNIVRLDLRANRIAELKLGLLATPNGMKELDLGDNVFKVLPVGLFEGTSQLRNLDVSGNDIGELEEGTFRDLPLLEQLDLSNNNIGIVRHSAFRDLPSIRVLNVSGNAITVLDGQFFGSRLPKLQIMDLSRNQIHYIVPNALMAVADLRHLDLSANKLTVFLEGTLQSCTYLESVSLAGNQLQHVDNGQFSHAIRLRTLDFSHNLIEAVGEVAFTNSSQIRFLNLRGNRLAALPEGVFNGFARLDLDLSHNNLSSLPADIFTRHRVGNLESVDLSNNQFTILPLSGLNEQYAALETLNVCNNRISHIPADANALVNVKNLDVSNNPLSHDSLQNIFGEPKTVRMLKASNCGIQELTQLETPFLQSLNLSGNLLRTLRPEIFQRATMLTTLVLSNNNLSTEVFRIWPQLPGLRTLDLSNNPLRDIGPATLGSLTRLENLDLSNLGELTRFDHEALKGTLNLKRLSIHGYPRLGFYDVRGILEFAPALESLRVEVKGTVLRDQLHPALNSRLRELVVYGAALQNLTSVSFAGMLAPSVHIGIHGTAIATIPNTIFLPLPSSMDVDLNVSGNRLALLGPQMLMTLNKKRNRVALAGLASNPLYCDCFMKPMLKWIKDRIKDGRLSSHELRQIVCAGGPDDLQGRYIWELSEDDLTCERRQTTTIASPLPATGVAVVKAEPEVVPPPLLPTATNAEPEPDIIYEAPTPRTDVNVAGTQGLPGSLTNIDSMIIVIIVGVVAFVCILIIIICIIKLRHNRVHYHGGPMAMAAVPGSGSSAACTCVKQMPGGNTNASGLCHCHPSFPPHSPHNGPLPPKLLALHCENRNSSLPRSVRSVSHSHSPYHQYQEGNDYR